MKVLNSSIARIKVLSFTQVLKKVLVLGLKKLDLGSALAVRLTKLTGKSKVPIHPKHFLDQKPWFVNYISKGDIILDLGSGNGQSAIKTARLSKKVIGLEIDDNLINIANRSARIANVKNVLFIKSDLEKKLNFEDNYFDRIIFLDVLEHLKKRDQILKETRRVLIPSGLMFLGVPNNQTSWKKLQRSVGLASFSDPDHKIEFTEEEIKDLLKKHGFKIEKISYSAIDTPFRGFFDVFGAFSIPLYKKISNWRIQKAQKAPKEASGFEIVAANLK